MASAVNVTRTGNGQVSTAPGWYAGFSIKENAGPTAVVEIYDDAAGGSSGTILDIIDLASGESAREFYCGQRSPGLWVSKGIFVKVTGSIKGSVRVG